MYGAAEVDGGWWMVDDGQGCKAGNGWGLSLGLNGGG